MSIRLFIEPDTVFGRLTVLSYSNGRVSCECSCGNFVVIADSHLLDGTTKSCGCLNRQLQYSRYNHFNKFLRKNKIFFQEEGK